MENFPRYKTNINNFSNIRGNLDNSAYNDEEGYEKVSKNAAIHWQDSFEKMMILIEADISNFLNDRSDIEQEFFIRNHVSKIKSSVSGLIVLMSQILEQSNKAKLNAKTRWRRRSKMYEGEIESLIRQKMVHEHKIQMLEKKVKQLTNHNFRSTGKTVNDVVRSTSRKQREENYRLNSKSSLISSCKKKKRSNSPFSTIYEARTIKKRRKTPKKKISTEKKEDSSPVARVVSPFSDPKVSSPSPHDVFVFSPRSGNLPIQDHLNKKRVQFSIPSETIRKKANDPSDTEFENIEKVLLKKQKSGPKYMSQETMKRRKS